MSEEQHTSPAVGAVESAADAAARLRLASAQLFAVSDWLAREHRRDNWDDLADRLGHDVRVLANALRWIDDDRDD